MDAWMQNLISDIERIAGADKVSHYQITVLPQILADFHKMLQKEAAGKTVREQYRMEDGSMEIELVGMKDASENVKVTSARAYAVC